MNENESNAIPSFSTTPSSLARISYYIIIPGFYLLIAFYSFLAIPYVFKNGILKGVALCFLTLIFFGVWTKISLEIIQDERKRRNRQKI